MSWQDYLVALQAVNRVDELAQRAEQRADQERARQRSAITHRGGELERDFRQVTGRLTELREQLNAAGAHAPDRPPEFDEPSSLTRVAQRVEQLSARADSASLDLASYRRTRGRLAQRPPVPASPTTPAPPPAQRTTRRRAAQLVVGAAAALVLILVIVAVLIANNI